jgi:hypothetical protein
MSAAPETRRFYMLRWKNRFTPFLVTAILIIAAVVNARTGTKINLGW